MSSSSVSSIPEYIDLSSDEDEEAQQVDEPMPDDNVELNNANRIDNEVINVEEEELENVDNPPMEQDDNNQGEEELENARNPPMEEQEDVNNHQEEYREEFEMPPPPRPPPTTTSYPELSSFSTHSSCDQVMYFENNRIVGRSTNVHFDFTWNESFDNHDEASQPPPPASPPRSANHNSTNESPIIISDDEEEDAEMNSDVRRIELKDTDEIVEIIDDDTEGENNENVDENVEKSAEQEEMKAYLIQNSGDNLPAVPSTSDKDDVIVIDSDDEEDVQEKKEDVPKIINEDDYDSQATIIDDSEEEMDVQPQDLALSDEIIQVVSTPDFTMPGTSTAFRPWSLASTSTFCPSSSSSGYQASLPIKKRRIPSELTKQTPNVAESMPADASPSSSTSSSSAKRPKQSIRVANFPCPLCPHRCYTEETLAVHLSVCQSMTVSKEELIRIVGLKSSATADDDDDDHPVQSQESMASSSSTDGKVRCGQCLRYFKSKRGASLHEKMVHRSRDPTTAAAASASAVSSSTSPSASSSPSTIPAELNEKINYRRCHLCDRTFAAYINLYQHVCHTKSHDRMTWTEYKDQLEVKLTSVIPDWKEKGLLHGRRGRPSFSSKSSPSSTSSHLD